MKLHAKAFRQLAVGVALAAAFYAALIAFADGRAVVAALTALDGRVWAVVLGLSLLNYLLRYARWDYYLRQFRYAVPPGTQLLIYIAGFAFTTTPAKAGEAMRSVYLAPYGVTYTHSLAAFFVERWVDMLAMLLVAALAVVAAIEIRGVLVAVAVLVLLSLQLVHSRWLAAALATRAAAAPTALTGKAAASLLAVLQTARPLLKSGPLYGGLLVGLLAWGAEGLALYIVLEHLGAELSPLLATGIYGMSILAGAATFIPGGLGGTELAMQYLLEVSAVAAPVAIAAVIICRLATLWFAVALGLAALGWLEWRSPPEAAASAAKSSRMGGE